MITNRLTRGVIREEKMIEKLIKISCENPEGFTFELATDSLVNFPSKGYAVALKETQNSFGVEGLKKALEYAKTTGYLGGWAEDGKFYYDAVFIIQDREEAIRVGRENEQIAIFDLSTGETIYL